MKNVSNPNKGSPRRKSKFKLSMDDPSHGVVATIIDLGLARMNGDEDVHWTPFDDEIFEGEGDYQFDIYRMMESGIGEEYRPVTNIMVSGNLFPSWKVLSTRATSGCITWH